MSRTKWYPLCMAAPVPLATGQTGLATFYLVAAIATSRPQAAMVALMLLTLVAVAVAQEELEEAEEVAATHARCSSSNPCIRQDTCPGFQVGNGKFIHCTNRIMFGSKNFFFFCFCKRSSSPGRGGPAGGAGAGLPGVPGSCGHRQGAPLILNLFKLISNNCLRRASVISKREVCAVTTSIQVFTSSPPHLLTSSPPHTFQSFHQG